MEEGDSLRLYAISIYHSSLLSGTGSHHMLYSPAVAQITDAVHAKGSKIFVQLMHCGRIAHPENLPSGAEMLAPSSIAAKVCGGQRVPR